MIADKQLREVSFEVKHLDNVDKCQRCWHRVPLLNQGLCPRCVSNVTAPGENRYYG